MKKYLLLFLLMILMTEINAQFYVWKDGQVILSLKDSYADSVTFVDPLLKYKFSVNDTLQVRFSPGNLQCNDYYFEWRFAENQYDIIGLKNTYISVEYDGWIDLFGWATCGWDSGFEVSSTSTDYRDYLVGGEWNNSFVGQYSMADWGVNKIGSEEPSVWRTPTSEEWNYLFTKRENAGNLFALATVVGQKGLIILPDSWVLPSGQTFTPSTQNRLVFQSGLYEDSDFIEDNYSDNVYTKSDWSIMEQAGAVFLPAAGRRWGTNIKNYPANPWGVYWSSTAGNYEREGNVRALSFYMSGVTPLAETSRVWGCSVRLIQEIK